MGAIVYAAVETYTGPGAGIYPSAVRTSLRLWLVNGERIEATVIRQSVDCNVDRLPETLDSMIEEAAAKRERADGPMMIGIMVNHAPSTILSRPPVSTTYSPLPRNVFYNLLVSSLFGGERETAWN